MRIICGWCKKFLRHEPGGPLVSHGVCDKCAERVLEQMDNTPTLEERRAMGQVSQNTCLQRRGAGCTSP